MKIIIAGAGEVGFHVAKMLAHEEHDIILIDQDNERLAYAESHIDVGTIKGNSVSIMLLEEAGVATADLLICATSSEETNITTAIIGKHLGAKRTIVRISNPEFQIEKEKLDMAELGIDSMVFPEDLASKEMIRLMERSGLTDSFEFGGGRLMLSGLVLQEGSQLENTNLVEAVQLNPKVRFTAVAIKRGNKTIIPRGDTIFKRNDQIYFISRPECVDELMSMAGKTQEKIRRIMILGGSLIGRLFAKQLQGQYTVTLVDKDKDKCFALAEQLPQVLVLCGDGSDVDFLEEEGINDIDAFIAVTEDSETNIISCLVAKNHDVKTSIALVENIDYISLSQNIGIDTLINKKMIAINNIFRHVRQGQVVSLTSLHGVDSEVLEFEVHNACRIADVPVKKLNFPREAVIAGVVRGEESFIASGETTIQNGDRVVVFTLPSAVHKVEEFFK